MNDVTEHVSRAIVAWERWRDTHDMRSAKLQCCAASLELFDSLESLSYGARGMLGIVHGVARCEHPNCDHKEVVSLLQRLIEGIKRPVRELSRADRDAVVAGLSAAIIKLETGQS